MKSLVSGLAVLLVLAVAGLSTAQGRPYEIWVANQTTDEVLIFDSRTLVAAARVLVDTDNTPTTSAPHLVTFTPDQRFALVANVRPPAGRQNVAIIDATARRLVTNIPAGPQAHQVVASPDGGRLWVVNVAANEIMEITSQSGTFTAGRRIPSGGIRPITLAFTSGGRKVYMTHGGSTAGSGSIVALEAASGQIVKKWENLGLEAVFTIASADGRRVFADQGFHASNPADRNNRLFVFDATTDTLIHQAQLPYKDLHGMVEIPSRDELWITARQANLVVVVETKSGRYDVVATIKVPDKPDGIDAAPDGSRVFVAHRGQAVTGDPFALTGTEPGFSIINTASRTVLGRIPVDGDVHGLAVRR